MKSRSLLIVLACLTLALTGSTTNQPTGAQIVIHADQVLAPVSPFLFGQNYGPWMNTTEAYVADYRPAGVTLLRYPGGNFGDENGIFPNNLDDLAALARGLSTESLDAEVLTTPPQIEEQVQQIRVWWADLEINPLGHEWPVPSLFLSEYSSSWASGVSRQLGRQVDALWNAEVVGRMANLGVEMAAHFALQGTRWHGMIDMLQEKRPVYGVYKLYRHWGVTQV
jgi:hypothetical protein